MKTGIDILAIGAHPDDIELSCGGTLAKAISQGKSVALLDLTQGEMGTRGTVAIRQKEAQRVNGDVHYILFLIAVLIDWPTPLNRLMIIIFGHNK